jgi:hypothetical protein
MTFKTNSYIYIQHNKNLTKNNSTKIIKQTLTPITNKNKSSKLKLTYHQIHQTPSNRHKHTQQHVSMYTHLIVAKVEEKYEECMQGLKPEKSKLIVDAYKKRQHTKDSKHKRTKQTEMQKHRYTQLYIESILYI